MFLKPFEKKFIRTLFFVLIISNSVKCFSQINIPPIWKSYNYVPERYEEIVWRKENGFHFLKKDSIFRKDFLQPVKLVFSVQQLTALDSLIKDIEGFSYSVSEKYLLMETNSNSIFRHSQTADYILYNTKTNEVFKLDSSQLQIPTFSPDEKRIVYFHQNDLFSYEIESKSTVQLTKDGKRNEIINGKSDWVHEEEFGFTKAFEISPDSKKIIYIKYDERKVNEYPLLFWNKSKYPELFQYKYPKAGENNAISTICLYSFDEKTTKILFDNSKSDDYYPFMEWIDENSVLILTLDRLQKHLRFVKLNVKTNEEEVLYEEKSEQYIELPTVKIKGNLIYFTSDKDGRNAIYVLENKIVNRLTELNHEVEDFYDFDSKTATLYYSRTFQFGNQICKQDSNGEIEILSATNKTAQLSLSPQFLEYIVSESAHNSVPTTVWHKNEVADTLISNSKLKSKLTTLLLVNTVFFTFVNSHGDSLDAWVMKPAKISKKDKLPVLIYFYGGPGFRATTSKYNATDYFWYQELVKQGYIVACVDPRGSGGKGTAFKKQTYEQLGLLESEDIRDFAQYFQAQKYVDPTRIGVWGWSYGGYLTTLCLNRFPETFKMGMAVAAVTDWRFYDNIYTERYMNTPQNNPNGYKITSPMYYSDSLKGRLLLIHGTGDDNVHPQNFYEYENDLIKKGKQFQQFLYPNRNHSIYGGNTRLHLFELMSNFILQNL